MNGYSELRLGPLDHVRATVALHPAASLLSLIAGSVGGRPHGVPGHWRPVVDRPGAWLRVYARVMRRLWREFGGVWERAGALLRKERERVGVAAVTGALDAVLSGLNSRFRFDGGSLRLPDQQGRRFDLDGRRLTFVPVVSGPGACLFSFDRPGPAWIGYPVPAPGLLWSTRTTGR